MKLPLIRRRPQVPDIPLPDPALPPSRRGEWDEAAVTNVEVTELVKRRIGTVTKPWNK